MESHSAWFQNPESLFLVIFTMWQNALETSCCNSYSQYAQNMGSSISKVTKWALKGSEGDFTQPDVEGNCPAEYWKCKDGLQCLRRDRVCDGTAWCYDNSDEYLVTRAQWNCLAGSWECKDGLRCLRGENVCDGRTHCIDESDENHAMCAQWTCPPGHWKCKDGRQCLRNERVCDGGMIPDCKDKSDEDPVICAQWKCAAGFWKCHDGLKCIEEGSVCDGNPSCNDISDEDPALCAQWNCTAGYWKCKDGLQCILERDVCYAQYDCNDKSDEDQTMCDQFICKENKIGDFTSEISTFTKCANNLQCIPTAHICDDEVECRDRSDELCDSKCLEVPLPPGERTIIKKCDEDSSKCIPVGQYCDGTAQCPDGSDETQAGCTCEDWGLLSCQTQEAEVTICFNTRWMTKEALSQASSHCKDFLHAIHASITPVENSKGDCVMVSSKGIDEPQCLNYSTNTSCRSLTYPISHGFPIVCMHGVLYNISESMELIYPSNNLKGVDIFCNACLLKDSDLNLFSKTGDILPISFNNFRIEGCMIKLTNISLILSSVTLQETLIEGIAYPNETFYNEMYFKNSTLSCHNNDESSKCGLYLTDINSAKVVLVSSQLHHFKLKISVRQLILMFNDSHITMPKIIVNVTCLEYLRIPAIIEFHNVTVTNNKKSIERNNNLAMPELESESLHYLIVFHLTHPLVVIKESYFNGVHLEIISKRHLFEPVFLSLLLENSMFVNSFHVGDGGGFRIISEVKNSTMIISNCTFLNNSAVKGLGGLKGQGGALYVEANSLKLTLLNCIFRGNKANDLGLSIYTTQGVNVNIENSTFNHGIDRNAPFQQSIMFINGKVFEFHGQFEVFNPRPNTYVGPIDIFYIGQLALANIKTFCPKWYNQYIAHNPMTLHSPEIPGAHCKCSPCIYNHYATSVQTNILLYNGSGNLMHKRKLNANESCLQCPYGAVCTGNNVMPRPNYWGYWHEGKLMFIQCPAGYCCSNSDSSKCHAYNYCPGNRTGSLCGACQDNFSVSILTGACTPESLCGRDQWFWLVAILATMAYSIWYTLKDDVFAFFFFLIRLVRIKIARSKGNESDAPIKLISIKARKSVSYLQPDKNVLPTDTCNPKVKASDALEKANGHGNSNQGNLCRAEMSLSNRIKTYVSSLLGNDAFDTRL